MSTSKNTVAKRSKVKTTSDKKINPKNYLYAILILVGGIVLTLYIFEWINVKKEEQLMNSYLISSNTIDSSIKDLDSLEQILKESPSSYFIYLSYTGDEDIYEFEKELKRVIDNYDLSDNFYYVDLTDMKKDNENYLKDINNLLKIDIKQVPAFIYVREGEILESNVLDGVNGTMLKIADIENILDIYEFESVK